MEEVKLVKKTRGLSTYNKVVNTAFTELVSPPVPEAPIVEPNVESFFAAYEELFFDIPAEGTINSHQYLVQRSQEYLGGSVNDPEKQALIEEINSLKQQLLDLGQTYFTINKLTF